jgi:Zn-finger nucleic acid-binding protein
MYRDQANSCPRCRVALDQVPEHHKWRCKSCVGALVSLDEIEAEMPDLPFTARTAAEEPLRCPLCGAGMWPVQVHGVPLDRCEVDRVVWFDRSELGRVRNARAAGQDAATQTFETLLLELITDLRK